MNNTRTGSKFPTIKRRIAQASSIARSGDRLDLKRRLARRAYYSTGAVALEGSLLPTDIMDSDDVRWTQPARRPTSGQPLTIGWVTTAPSPGSGGHTTIFRMIEGLETAGHRCVIYLYDRHQSPVSFHAGVIRRHWPGLKAEIRDVRDGLKPADGFFATSWQTAHILGTQSSTPGHRFYFVQDYEPYFYPKGSEYFLAQDTYRFGYRTIVIGGMITEILKSQHGVVAERVEFGCDTAVYSRTNCGARNGVVFYAKPEVARRGYLLGIAALERFHELHPGQQIHIFGDRRFATSFPSENHGTVSPKRLSELYNMVVAGIAMSFTNISLVPYEMLACGVVPIVNETDHARAELVHPEVLWTKPTPTALVRALSRAVTSGDIIGKSACAADGIMGHDWAPPQRRLVRIVEDEIWGT